MNIIFFIIISVFSSNVCILYNFFYNSILLEIYILIQLFTIIFCTYVSFTRIVDSSACLHFLDKHRQEMLCLQYCIIYRPFVKDIVVMQKNSSVLSIIKNVIRYQATQKIGWIKRYLSVFTNYLWLFFTVWMHLQKTIPQIHATIFFNNLSCHECCAL